jgi:hypothetical protein
MDRSAAGQGPGQLAELDVRRCLELLATQPVGRVGVVVRGRPEIFPVSYRLDASQSVVFRTTVGTKLAAAVNHHVVFEVDSYDPAAATGWSVVVHGVAHQTMTLGAGGYPGVPWVGPTTHLVRIAQVAVSGRRLGPDTAAPDTGGRDTAGLDRAALAAAAGSRDARRRWEVVSPDRRGWRAM